jgi:hypothetical protein
MSNPFLARFGRYFGDGLPYYLRALSLAGLERLSTLGAWIRARWWRVSLGRGNTFVGRPSFVRAGGSSITIGSQGRFLSRARSNRHGIERQCMLTTLRRDPDRRRGRL